MKNTMRKTQARKAWRCPTCKGRRQVDGHTCSVCRGVGWIN